MIPRFAPTAAFAGLLLSGWLLAQTANRPVARTSGQLGARFVLLKPKRLDASGHALVPVTEANVKDRMGQQAHVAAASYVLVLAADLLLFRKFSQRKRAISGAVLSSVGCLLATAWMLAFPDGICSKGQQ